MFFGEHGSILTCTVKLDLKNRQDKNQLGFKNQIPNDQVDQISFKDRQDKNNLTLRTKMAVTKNVLKVKFDCISLLFAFLNPYERHGKSLFNSNKILENRIF